MVRKRKPDRNDNGVSPAMARVIVHETYPHKLKNGSVLVVDAKPDVQTVKREVADALIRCGRGELHKTDMKFNSDSKGTD